MNITVKENNFYDAMVEIERARIISNVLLNTYFSQDVSSSTDLWKVSGYFYDEARILLETTLSMVVDAEKKLNDATTKTADNREIGSIS